MTSTGYETDESERYADYHLARGGILTLVFAGLILITELLVLQPPTVFKGPLGRGIVIVFTICGLLVIGLSLAFIGGAVFVRGVKLDTGERSLSGAIRGAVDYTLTLLNQRL